MIGSRYVSRLVVVVALATSRIAISQGSLSESQGFAIRATVLITSNRGQGSGVFVSSTGVIITTLDVIDAASSVIVRTSRGEVFDSVTLLVRDRRQNLAVLKINGAGLPFLEVGSSDHARIGDSVIIAGFATTAGTAVPAQQSGKISSSKDAGGNTTIALATPISFIGTGWAILGLDGKMIGFGTKEGRSLVVKGNKYIREDLKAVDHTQPIFQWKGANNFERSLGKGISGYWKSTNGNVYLVHDEGDRVNITNMSSPKFRYDAKWNGDLLIGVGYNDDKKRFVVRVVDPDHIIRTMFGFEKTDTDEAVLKKAREKIKNPDDVWIKLH